VVAVVVWARLYARFACIEREYSMKKGRQERLKRSSVDGIEISPITPTVLTLASDGEHEWS